MKKSLGTVAVTALLVLAGGTSAMAAEGPTAGAQNAPTTTNGTDSTDGTDSLCSGSRVVYKSSSSAGSFTQASGANSSVTGGPGVTLAISTSTTFTVSGSITATTGVTVSNVVASVKADVGVTIGASKSGTTTNSGSWTVPSSYGSGRLAIGSMKYSGTTTKYIENSSCTLVKQGSSATFNAPQQEWHFQTSRVS